MTPKHLSLVLAPLTFALATGSLSACSDDTSSVQAPVGSPELRAEVLENFSSNVLLESLKTFGVAVAALELELQILPDLSATSTEPAQLAYRTAFSAWQQVALMQIGPLASVSEESIASEGLGVEVYWPLENTCSINESLVSQSYESKQDFAESPVDMRSLSAIEYLLFAPGRDNTCSFLSTINESGSWDALSDSELEERRISYLRATAQLVQKEAQEILKRYRDAGANDTLSFVEQIAKPGVGESVYAQSQDVFNSWADALLLMDTETRDMNLGKPAGIAECFATCPVESVHQDFALLSIRRNLESFDLQFFGGIRNDKNFTFGGISNEGRASDYPSDSAPGLDDILIEIGEQAVVDEMAAAIDQAYESLDAIEVPLEDAIDNEESLVTTAHKDLGVVVSLLKTDVKSLLNWSTSTVGSDTD